jgi:glycosyltransferase involved in cell wall biosynthesis
MSRVLLLIKGLGRGGAEQLLVSAAPHLDRKRFDYEVAYLRSDKDALVGELQAAGLPVSCLYGDRTLDWMPRLRRLVRERSIDIVHCHSPYAAIGARVGLRGRRRPRIVYTEHGVWDFYRPATYWGNLLTFAGNDHVFAVSAYMRSSIRYPRALRFLRMPPVEILYQGLDLSAVEHWPSSDGVREELGIPEDAPVVGTIANFRTQKRHNVLLRAAVLVRRAIPDVRFVLVGVGPLEAQIRRQARELDLDGTVVFAGRREDAPRVAASFDVFALPSGWEGLSIALLEAMTIGKPLVVTRVGGITELVRHNREGLLVHPDDHSDLADGIVTLLTDRMLADRLGEGARRRAAHFDIRKAVRRQEEVYGQLLERRRPGMRSRSANRT